MAPSRRKGASKAALAAAARRQWKVGDLVLAKVKGFPAWPAVVSEPVKWGYSADLKKVLVFFFGTEQIAFCNPADVEAFTEEKKQSLIGKRHGKGADFVRAVKEIIDSFEKLKKEDQDDEFNSSANGGNSVDSSTNFGSKDQEDGPEAIPDVRPKSPSSTVDKNELIDSVEDASATALVDSTLDKEDLIEGPAATTIVSETLMPTTCSSRKRSGDLRLQGCISKREEAPAPRSRSSSRMESRRLRNIIVSCGDDTNIDRDITGTSIEDRSFRRNKRTRKSPDASMCDDVKLATSVSNGCAEDDGSEVVPVDSGTFSWNDGSVIESGCKGEHSETVVECLEGDELIKAFDLQIKAVSKKKRKPNRKRVANDAAEAITILDKETVQDVALQSSSHGMQTDCGNMNGNSSKEDGDEHLPLVKRARVRMNKPSFVEEVDSSLHIQESLKELSCNRPGLINTSPICNDNCPGGRDPLVANGAVDNITSSKVCTQSMENRPQLWNSKKDQSFGCSADGEAVLPPSKRLHRALEAMSANAAEDDERCNYGSSAMRTSTTDCPSSVNSCITVTVEPFSGNGPGLPCDDSFGNDTSGLPTSPNCVILEENTKSAMEVDICDRVILEENTKLAMVVDVCDQRRNNPVTSNNQCSAQNNQCSVHGSPDSGHHVGDKIPCAGSASLCTIGTALQTESPGNSSPSTERIEGGSLDEFPRKDEGHVKVESGNDNAENLESDCDTLEPTLKCLDPQGSSQGFVEVSHQIDYCPLQCGEEGHRENIKSLEPQLQVNSVQDMLDAVKEVNLKQIEDDPSLVSNPNEYSTEKHVAGVRSSPSVTEGGDSLAHATPPNTSGCRISTSDSSNILHNNGSCSPDVDLQHKRTSTPVDEEEKSEAVVYQGPKSVSRYEEALAALSSFETLLGTLTRTKDSIGRATHVAIDCGKIGVASKVLEILARHLENESTLHRRVDFFFLVDSIAQHSRNLKGDVGGMYASAIQAVLSRLLSAAAPPGSSANENRRQCLKVLKLWLERRIVPESIIRCHMRELDSLGGSSSAGAYCRRSSRTERSLDDPLREMEGMLVDEYGSNSSFQLPGFCMPRMVKDEGGGSDSDGESFEAVTPEHKPQTNEEHEVAPATERHRHILEDVDGELEMEDVAPSCDVDMSSSCGVAGVNVVPCSHQFEQHIPHSFAPPVPQDVPPSSPLLPSSPPPPPPPASLPPPHVIHPPCATSDLTPYTDSHNVHDSRVRPPPQQLNGPRINQAIPDAVHYRAPESRDLHRQMPDSTSCSYSSFPSNSGRNIPQTDGATFHNKGYSLQPPHAPPPNQFSYAKGDHHVKPRREVPPPYHNRFDYMQNGDREHYYNNHERMKAPYEPRESWRFPAHSYSGPRYPEKGKAPYGNVPFSGPPRGPTRLPGQGWRFPPRSTGHRHFIPPYDGPIPVTSRGPGFWRPR